MAIVIALDGVGKVDCSLVFADLRMVAPNLA